MSTETVNETEVLKISVTSRDAQEALDIAATIAEVAPGAVSDIIEGSSVKIVDTPKVTEEISLRNLFR